TSRLFLNQRMEGAGSPDSTMHSSVRLSPRPIIFLLCSMRTDGALATLAVAKSLATPAAEVARHSYCPWSDSTGSRMMRS
ncbi:hypothetical protein PFISCL1PPCAC_22453, partial [Pristionchus fissidentatus]